MTKRSRARHLAAALPYMIGLLLTTGCATPVGVERVDATTAQHELTATTLTADELSPSARNVLRRWVLSERYDDDPAGAIAALHTIATDGRGDEDEVITMAEMAYLYAEKTHQRPYFLGVYSFGIIHAFASADDSTVEFKSGNYQAPFGWVQVAVNPSGFEWHNRRVVALTPVEGVVVRGLANRYRHPGIGAALAAATEPIVAERGMQVAPRMKLPMTAVLRLDMPRRQLPQRQLHATL